MGAESVIAQLLGAIATEAFELAANGGDAKAALDLALEGMRSARRAHGGLAKIEAAEDKRLKDIYEGEHRP